MLLALIVLVLAGLVLIVVNQLVGELSASGSIQVGYPAVRSPVAQQMINSGGFS